MYESEKSHFWIAVIKTTAVESDCHIEGMVLFGDDKNPISTEDMAIAMAFQGNTEISIPFFVFAAK